MTPYYLHKISRNFQDYGFAVTAGKCLDTIMEPIFTIKWYRLYGINLTNTPTRKINGSPFTFKYITGTETDIINQIETMEEWIQGKTASKLANGGLCLVALDNNVVAGFNIVQFKEIDFPLLHYKKHLKINESFSEQITVNKHYRGKELGTALRYEIFNGLKSRGIKRLYGGAQKSNTASLKLAKKVGFSFIADLAYIKFFVFSTIRIRRIHHGVQ